MATSQARASWQLCAPQAMLPNPSSQPVQRTGVKALSLSSSIRRVCQQAPQKQEQATCK
jgi:hypothetical protein